MTAPPRGRKIIAAGGLSGRELERQVRNELAEIKQDYDPDIPTRRCRVCHHPESRTKVNTLLAYGMGSSEILHFVAEINEKRSKNNKITRDVIRNHRQRHFNIQAPTQAAYRRILEKRKAQLSEEFGEGAEQMLTGMAYLEIVGQKGFQTLIDEETKVPFEVGLQAQLKLEDMMRDGAVEEQIAQMRRDVSMLEQAVREVVPEAYLKEISERIDELSGNSMRRAPENSEIIDVEVVTDDFYDQDDDDAHKPTITADEGDSIED